MVTITDVIPHSYAARCGITAGDILLKLNNHSIRDVLDYRFYLAERSVSVEVQRGDETFVYTIHKGEYDDIGLGFETPLMDKKQTCRNKCIFCFIDQNPCGMRDTIYFKDDDSRLSFLQGNYVTLTNMSEADVERIIEMKISPIRISVHTTNPDLRVFMMKNKHAGEVLRYLDRFAEAGTAMCGQIVLCRGINDGEELSRSLTDLAKYYPAMGSVSVVPAGLTCHREDLYPLKDFSKEEAGAVIDLVDSFGDKMFEKFGTRVFYAADEFYLKADRPLPNGEFYEEYTQLENGVGMLRSFEDEFAMALSDAREEISPEAVSRTVSVATGVASFDMISRLCESLSALYPHLHIHVYKIINRYFGESITVSGLLTGRDMKEQLSGQPLGEQLLLPRNCLRAGEDIFLCGMTLPELQTELATPIRITENDGYEFLYALLGR